MNDRQFLSLLGMCRRAGKLSCGHDSAVDAMAKGRAKLCLLSRDSSERLRKEMMRESVFGGREIPVRITDYDMYEIGHATGLKSAVLTVDDDGFAERLTGLLRDEGEETECLQ